MKLIEAGARCESHLSAADYGSGNLALETRLEKTSPRSEKRGSILPGSTRARGRISTSTRLSCRGVPAAEAAGRELLSGEHDARRVRGLGEDAFSGSAGAGRRLLHGDPRAVPMANSGPSRIREVYKEDLTACAEGSAGCREVNR